MNRVWTALLLLATVVVVGSVGYVLVHNDKVPHAGTTPGFTAPAPKPSGSAGSGSASASGSTSGGASSSKSSDSKAAAHITFLGDNWTTGFGVKHDAKKTFPGMIATQLKVKDTAVGADGAGYAKHNTTGDSYASLIDKVVASKPTVVVVTGGRNDVSDDATTLNTAAKDLFATLKSKLPNAKLIAVAPFWGDSDHPSDLTKVDDAVKAGVEAAGGQYLNIADPLHNHSDWMADDANPNDKGNKAIAEALKPDLKTLI